jgi:molybdate transport system ATP-binding protein
LPATVDVTAAAVAELDLAPGRRVWLSAKATDVSAYPAP